MEPKKIFDKNLKELILKPLNSYGFKKYKTSFIGRITSNCIFEFFYFQKSGYGVENGFTVSACIMPLFVPSEQVGLSLGERLGTFESGYERDKWWQYKNEKEAENSFQEISQIITAHVFPWFNALKDVKGLIREYESRAYRIPLGAVLWEQYDFGLIYLKDNQLSKGKELLQKAKIIFLNGEFDWKKDAVKQCDEAILAIDSGAEIVKALLKKYEQFSKKNLGLIDF